MKGPTSTAGRARAGTPARTRCRSPRCRPPGPVAARRPGRRPRRPRAARDVESRPRPFDRLVLPRPGPPARDLVQEGAVGLLDAIDRYDPDRGASFEAYARFRVRRAIRNALTDKARLIRLPKQMVERRRAIESAEARLAASAAGHSADTGRARRCDRLVGSLGLDARTAAMATISLDQPAAARWLSALGSRGTREQPIPALIALERERTRQLTAAVADLPERQRRIVSCRWGIDGAPVSTKRLRPGSRLSPRRAQTIGRDALYELSESARPVRDRD